MKKQIITLDINYNKEITDLTYPYMKKYAHKIQADFNIITERKFPEYGANIEKFQLYELSKEYDWTIFLDADAIVHPNTPDITEIVGKDTVIFNGNDISNLRFRPNNYTRRDGRWIGACTWLTCFSDWCRDLWHPYENPYQYIDEIFPLHMEINYGYEAEHIIDDYLVTRNIAKYGLKVKSIVKDIYGDYSEEKEPGFFYHLFCVKEKEKIASLKKYIHNINNHHFGEEIKTNYGLLKKQVWS